MDMVTNRHRAGFTLVEVIVVTALVGIVLGIVFPLLRPEKFQLDAGVVVVASTITAQQRNSVLRQHNLVLAFDTAAGLVRVHQDADNDGAIDSGETWSVVELEEGVVFGLGAASSRAGVTEAVSMTQTQGGLPSLSFTRNGAASEEVVIYLTSERARETAGTAYAEDSRAIEVERATGRVRCYSFASGTWNQTC